MPSSSSYDDCALMVFALLMMTASVATHPPSRTASSTASDTYRAAAVQYTANASMTNLDPSAYTAEVMRAYAHYTNRAASNGVELIVFPESSLWSPGLAPGGTVLQRRLRLAKYAENIPAVGTLLCQKAGKKYRSSSGGGDVGGGDMGASTEQLGPQLRAAGCMARNAGLIVAINLIDTVKCNGHDNDNININGRINNNTRSSPSPSPVAATNENDPARSRNSHENMRNDAACPTDGHFLYNTEVVVNETGHLLARYHKRHIFGTAPVLDRPTVPELVAFTASFGVEFGVFTCFDIEFPIPAQALATARHLRHFIASTTWSNEPPLLSATMIQQGWSRAFASNLISANTGASFLSAGSGLYSAGRVLASVYNSSAELPDNHLLIADMPKNVSDANLNQSDSYQYRHHHHKQHQQEKQKQKQGHHYGTAKAVVTARETDAVANDTTLYMKASEEVYSQPLHCRLSAFQAGPCVLVNARPKSSTQDVTVSSGTVNCTASFTLASVHSGAIAALSGTSLSSPHYSPSFASSKSDVNYGRYAIFAFDEAKRFPATPDALRVQACGLVLCEPVKAEANSVRSGDDPNQADPGDDQREKKVTEIACAQVSTNASLFSTLNLVMQGHNATVLPMVASNAVELLPPEATAIEVSHNFAALTLNEPHRVLSALFYAFPSEE